MDNFAIDSGAFRDYVAAQMPDSGARAHQIRALSGVAGHLTSALDALTLSGCDQFAADILEMLAVIDGLIALLEESGDGAAALTF